MTDPLSLVIIAAAFLLGGGVKGLAGMGLPVVTVAMLTFAFGLPNAMSLMIVPGLLTNIWQATAGGQTVEAFKRIAPFLLPSLLTIWFGTGLLVTMDNSKLVFVLGGVLTIYAVLNISGYGTNIPKRHETWAAPVLGLINGIATGMTGVTSTPSVIYMNSLGMKREMFVQAMGLLFLTSYLVLSLSLLARGLLDMRIGGLSFMAFFPAVIGMYLGQKLRKLTSETGFKKILNAVLFFVGLYLMVRSGLF